MFDKFIRLDKSFFVFLNGLGSERFDWLWLLITKQVYWAPFFLLIFYLLQKNLGWKKFGYYVLFTAILILVCDQTANLFKYGIQRIRPCNDEEIKGIIRIVKSSNSFSFFSAHAANSMGTTVFAFNLLKKHYKHIYLLFLFPIIFAYSRIYIGVHFPSDILMGYFVGTIFGIISYKLFAKYVIRNM